MCKNAQGTVASWLNVIETTAKNLLSVEGLANTPEATAFFAAYDVAVQAIANWKNGTISDSVLQVLGALQQAFNALPVPENYKVLANIIGAGIVAIIGIIKANSPAVTSNITVSVAPEDVQVHHQLQVASDTEAQVKNLVPGFKRSLFHSPEGQYKDYWNKTIDVNQFPQNLKVK